MTEPDYTPEELDLDAIVLHARRNAGQTLCMNVEALADEVVRLRARLSNLQACADYGHVEVADGSQVSCHRCGARL